MEDEEEPQGELSEGGGVGERQEWSIKSQEQMKELLKMDKKKDNDKQWNIYLRAINLMKASRSS